MNPTEEPLDRDIVQALDALTYPVRPVSADAIIARARARAAQRRVRFAAAAVVMLAASVAAALPGSPVRRWIVQAFRGESAQTEQRPSATPPVALQTAPSPDLRGIATAIGASAEVAFRAWQETGAVVIRFIPDAELRLRASDSTAAFLVRQAGVTVNNGASRASYELELWSETRNVRVLVNGRAVFERREGEITAGPTARADGSYVVSLRAPDTR